MQQDLVGIYAFCNKITGLRYIGQSRNLSKRRAEHMRSLRRGDHHSRYLQRSVHAHGLDCLEYAVLEYCNIDEITAREQFWLDFYRPAGLYNSAPVADSNLGVVWSEDSRRKQSAAQKGRIQSEDAKRKIGDAHRGKKLPEAQVALMRITRAGYRHSDEAKASMSLARKGKKFSEQHVANMTASKIGRKHSPASIEKMRLAKLGRKHTEQAKARIALAGMGRVRSAESNRKAIETRMRNKSKRELDATA